MLPVPLKGQPVHLSQKGTDLLLYEYEISTINTTGPHTLAVRRLVPRITRSVFAENISAF